MPLELKITTEQQIRVTLAPKTQAGKDAQLDGAPSWVVTTGNSQVVIADDGLSALIVSSNQPGETQILVTADANLGTGEDEVETISDTIKVTVGSPSAASLGLVAGQPENKPEPEA